MKTISIALLLIDPQNDFIDGPEQAGALAVPGAYSDCLRLERLIDSQGSRITNIFVTLDTHQPWDIAHPLWWKASNLTGIIHPPNYTEINKKDIGVKWQPVREQDLNWAFYYAEELEKQNKSPLTLWPVHCVEGTWGHNVQPDVHKALMRWQAKTFKHIKFINKGRNPNTEHFSAIKAEVQVPTDKETLLNTKLIGALMAYDAILVAGEAKSHCVAATMKDIADNVTREQLSRFILLEDCTSNVPTFEYHGDSLIESIKQRGMKVSQSQYY